MDPQSNYVPGPSSPPLPVERSVDVPAPHAAALAVPSTPPLPVPVAAASAQALAPSVPTSAADDNATDLDEEWVRKAKAIVEKTKNDPFQASRELGKMKADYLRTRYNKQIKVAEDHPR